MAEEIKKMPSRKASTPLYKTDQEINGILPMIADLIILGASETDILQAMGYSPKSRKALTRLKKKFPQLDATIKGAKMQVGGKIMNALMECAIGATSTKITTKKDADGNVVSIQEEITRRSPNVNAIALMLASQYKEYGWAVKDRGSSPGAEIQIDEVNTNVIAGLSNDELYDMMGSLERKLDQEKQRERLVEVRQENNEADDES